MTGRLSAERREFVGLWQLKHLEPKGSHLEAMKTRITQSTDD